MDHPPDHWPLDAGQDIFVDNATGHGNLLALFFTMQEKLSRMPRGSKILLALIWLQAKDFSSLQHRYQEEEINRLHRRIAEAIHASADGNFLKQGTNSLYRVGPGEFALLVEHESCSELHKWALELRQRLSKQTYPPLEELLMWQMSAICYPTCATSFGHLLAYTHLFLNKNKADDLHLACPGNPQYQNTQFLAFELHNNATNLINSLSPKILNTITELSKTHLMAFTDPMTELPNQRAARLYLQKLMTWADNQKQPIGLMLIDGDKLYEYNELFGYEAGNEMIHWLGQRLRRLVPAAHYVARWLSGDEFLVFCPGKSCEQVTLLAQRLCDAIHQASHELLLPITVSVGTATYPRDAKSGKELLRSLEMANKLAKRKGRNQVVNFREHIDLVGKAPPFEPSSGHNSRPRIHRHDEHRG